MLKERIAPIVVLFLYLNCSVLMFAVGPWPWPVNNPNQLFAYLMLSNLALLLGYLSAIKARPGRFSWRIRARTLFEWGVTLSIVLVVLRYVARASWKIGVFEGFSDPGGVYNRITAIARDVRAGEGGLVGYAEAYGQLCFGALTVLVLPFGIIKWRHLSTSWRLSVIGSLTGSILVNVLMTGATKHLADLCLMVPWVVWLAARDQQVKEKRVKLGLVSLTGILAFALTFAFFASTVAGRSSDGEPSVVDPLIGIAADLEHPLVRVLPERWRAGELALINYWVQGYFNLSLALKEPFVPCYGVGNSLFIQSYVERLTGDRSIYDRTYVGRIEARYGQMSGLGRWHSIYPWLASDVTFPGALVVVFIVGRVLALAWYDTLKGDNPFAVSLFLYLVLLVAYAPGNNQLLQNSYQCIPFCMTIVLWLMSRGREHRAAS